MQKFFENVFYGVGINDVIDILIVAFVIYKLLGLIKQTRAEQLMKGVVVLVVATFLSGLLNLHTINWLLKGTVALGAVAILVVFQPELRRALEYMGRSKIVKAPLREMDKERGKQITSHIVNAVETFSRDRVGALIVFENDTLLGDIVKSGTIIDGKCTKELLGNIFYPKSPLHDGAMVIRKDSVYAAGCILPLTDNNDLSSKLGTRHRAAIGITEQSDALAIVVSEETGAISYALNGTLYQDVSTGDLRDVLTQQYIPTGSASDEKIISKIARRFKNNEK